ncbi:hypothetical protein C1280_24980 [Gemmata obscuriglobus]|uniref:Uncharacterized protein n=1 Tax=Gemmata obscuriglobus TaxID=114 RepID=A0A2Z3HAB7_9BACT|nr:hypothetical protein C1280_24980 [Gemmata obscuriglobus]
MHARGGEEPGGPRRVLGQRPGGDAPAPPGAVRGRPGGPVGSGRAFGARGGRCGRAGDGNRETRGLVRADPRGAELGGAVGTADADA